MKYTNDYMVEVIESGVVTSDLKHNSSSDLHDVSLFTDKAEYIHLNTNHTHLCNSGKTMHSHCDNIDTIRNCLKEATYVVLNWCDDQSEVFKKDGEDWARVQIIRHFDDEDILGSLFNGEIVRYVAGLLTPEEKEMFEDLEKTSDDI